MMPDHQIIKPRRNWDVNRVPLPSDLVDNEIAINFADGILYAKNPSTGNIVSITLGGSVGSVGSANIVEAATASAFPATGASETLYIATDVSRIYRWSGSVYVEIGTSGGGGGSGSDDPRWNYFTPSAPTSVTATAGNAQATVSWTAPAASVLPITDYAVQFQQGSGAWQPFTDSVSTSTSATVTGLQNSVAHQFRVAAVNAIGQGPWSAASASVTPASEIFRAIPVLTSNTSNGVASTNNTWGGNPHDAWSAFDGNTTTTWYTNPSGTFPAYLQYEFAGSAKSLISGYTLAPFLESGYASTQPTAWTFSGSDDGTNFTVLDTRSGISWPGEGSTQTFTLAASVAYSKYRWTFTGHNGAGWVAISTAQLTA